MRCLFGCFGVSLITDQGTKGRVGCRCNPGASTICLPCSSPLFGHEGHGAPTVRDAAAPHRTIRILIVRCLVGAFLIVFGMFAY